MTNEEAKRQLEKIRELVTTDNDGPEGSMGPRWILAQVREILDGPDTEPRTPGCECQLEAGDSPCRIHGEDDHPRAPERNAPPDRAELAEQLVAELMAASMPKPTTSRRLEPIGKHGHGHVYPTRDDADAARPDPDPPHVCPGCHAVAPERCAPGCIDAEIEAEHRHAIESGDYDRDDDDDDEIGSER